MARSVHRTPTMGLRALFRCLGLSAACLCLPAGPALGGDPGAGVGDGFWDAATCRYRSVWIDYARQATGMSGRDARLNSLLARLMRRELRLAGHRVTSDPGEAYFSLMLMAANTGFDGEFAFTATMSLRNLDERSGGGLSAYSRPGESAAPTLFTGLSYGARAQLDQRVREYVRAADAALLPALRRLCDYEAADRMREIELEMQLPGFGLGG